MQRWMCGATKNDRVRNEHIRGTTRVTEASKKDTAKRLKWYGRVLRNEEERGARGEKSVKYQEPVHAALYAYLGSTF